eukprot:scaffold8184_cov164-Skeletonema_marinoi.AAC.6
MFFSRIGTVQDVSSHSSQQRIHKGVGIFSASMEIEGTANFKPSPRMGEEANLCFNLNILLNVRLALLGDSKGINGITNGLAHPDSVKKRKVEVVLANNVRIKTRCATASIDLRWDVYSAKKQFVKHAGRKVMTIMKRADS